LKNLKVRSLGTENITITLIKLAPPFFETRRFSELAYVVEHVVWTYSETVKKTSYAVPFSNKCL
jgi:hypothetical protein